MERNEEMVSKDDTNKKEDPRLGTGLVFGPFVMSQRGDCNNCEEFIDSQVKNV